ncbi:MAG: hypothetical protein ABIN96_15845 [Rubrivivax sp.]
MILVDTNILLDVLQDDPEWAPWSIARLRAQANTSYFSNLQVLAP